MLRPTRLNSKTIHISINIYIYIYMKSSHFPLPLEKPPSKVCKSLAQVLCITRVIAKGEKQQTEKWNIMSVHNVRAGRYAETHPLTT